MFAVIVTSCRPGEAGIRREHDSDRQRRDLGFADADEPGAQPIRRVRERLHRLEAVRVHELAAEVDAQVRAATRDRGRPAKRCRRAEPDGRRRGVQGAVRLSETPRYDGLTPAPRAVAAARAVAGVPAGMRRQGERHAEQQQ